MRGERLRGMLLAGAIGAALSAPPASAAAQEGGPLPPAAEPGRIGPGAAGGAEGAPEGGARPEARPEAEGRRVTLLVAPVRTDAEAQQLRLLLGRVAGVLEVAIQAAPQQPGAALVTISGQATLKNEALSQVMRGAGLQARLLEEPGRAGAAQRATLLAGPVRNEAEGQRLRQALQQLPGVKVVDLRAGDRPGAARVVIDVPANVNTAALGQALRQAGFEARLLEVTRAAPGEAARPGQPADGTPRAGPPDGETPREGPRDAQPRPEGGPQDPNQG